MVKSTNDEVTNIRSNQPHTKMPPFDNPCQKEQELSFKCLSENGYDKDSCSLEFANYKVCKEFWNRVRLDRRSKGIYPHIPDPEERATIKEEYMNKKKI